MINPLLNKSTRLDATPNAWVEVSGGTAKDYVELKLGDQIVSTARYMSKGIAYLPAYKNGTYTVNDQEVKITKNHSVVYTGIPEPSKCKVVFQIVSDRLSEITDSKNGLHIDFDVNSTRFLFNPDSSGRFIISNADFGTYEMTGVGYSGNTISQYTFPYFSITTTKDNCTITFDDDTDKTKYQSMVSIVSRSVEGLQIVYKVNIMPIYRPYRTVYYSREANSNNVTFMTCSREEFNNRAYRITGDITYATAISGNSIYLAFYCDDPDIKNNIHYTTKLGSTILTVKEYWDSTSADLNGKFTFLGNGYFMYVVSSPTAVTGTFRVYFEDTDDHTGFDVGQQISLTVS